MPPDKHNSRTARARDLISSLINIALSWDVPFHQLQQLQCLHHGATFVPLCVHILSSPPRKVTICGRHLMASVRDIKDRRGTSHTMPLLTMLWNEFDIAEIEALWLSCIKVWDARFTSIFSIFSTMVDGLQRCFSWCCLLILLCNRQNIAEYEAYWLMGVAIINPWSTCQPFFLGMCKLTNKTIVFLKK